MTSFATKGIIEGFYGQPWTPVQRLRLIELMDSWGMNFFLLAPKDDPRQRLQWDSAMAQTELDELAGLSAACEITGIEFGVAISPGLTIEYSSDVALEGLIQRCAEISRCGVRIFALFLDDIPGELQYESDKTRYHDNISAHADLIARWAAALRANFVVDRLIVCPEVYHGFGSEPYIVELCALIPTDIEVFWTGRQICSTYLHTSDANSFELNAGRKPLYWDNYPVNDAAMTYELHIGPYQGREATLTTASLGIVTNPMPLFEASLIPLFTVGEFLAEPENYEPERSWNRALMEFFPDPRERGAFHNFGMSVQDSCLSESAAPELESRLFAAVFEWRTGEIERAGTLLKEIARGMACDVEVLLESNFSRPDLIAEIRPWIEKYALVGEAIQSLAGVVDQEPSQGVADLVQGALSSVTGNRYRVGGDALAMLLTEVITDLRFQLANVQLIELTQ